MTKRTPVPTFPNCETDDEAWDKVDSLLLFLLVFLYYHGPQTPCKLVKVGDCLPQKFGQALLQIIL